MKNSKRKKNGYKYAFFRALKDLGCYHAFIKNFNKLNRYVPEFNEMPLEDFIHCYIKKHKSYKQYLYFILNDAFEWHRTDEGFEYWSSIAQKLLNIDRNVFENYNDKCIYNEEEINNLKKLLK